MRSVRIAPPEEAGVPFVVTGVICDSDGPLAGARPHVHHTDSSGCDSPGCRDEPKHRLPGDPRTGADGCFRSETIRPGSYPDSNVQQHVHFEREVDGTARVDVELVVPRSPG
jgi:protocatechuate 3,4-dioxygenase beta subunit